MQPKDRIFVAIDVDSLDDAKRMMDQCAGLVTNVKFGLQLATMESWALGVAAAHERGLKVFCDAKFKDIPNTVEHAAYALATHRPEFFTIMADNSLEALRAARKGVDRAVSDSGQAASPKIIAVTVLTSIDPAESQLIYGADPKTKTLQFAKSAAAAGLDAIVCSPEEVGLLRAEMVFADMLLITPGVRPAWAAANEQARVATPGEAIKNGADMLVIGRPITEPPAAIGSVKTAIARIIEEIEEALA